MKKLIIAFLIIVTTYSCKDNGDSKGILPRSVGSTNKILTVMKSDLWLGKVGDEMRTVFGEHQVGLPQPETLLSVSQVDPEGFGKLMNNNKAILIAIISDKTGISVKHDKYATPQTVVYASAKNEDELTNLIKTKGKEIIKIFKDQDIKFTQNVFKNKKIDEQRLKTIKDLNISLTIPKDYKLVKDSIGFLWMSYQLKSGIARGDGSNNILIYSAPLEDETKVVDNITSLRDVMGEKHIPGSKEGMYMITEQAYTPFTYEATIDGKKAYETRGKWEVKNDFMAGPFLNYTILDKENKRLVVFEGFTYAPLVNKRDFIFELEAIAKSIKFN